MKISSIEHMGCAEEAEDGCIHENFELCAAYVETFGARVKYSQIYKSPVTACSTAAVSVNSFSPVSSLCVCVHNATSDH